MCPHSAWSGRVDGSVSGAVKHIRHNDPHDCLTSMCNSITECVCVVCSLQEECRLRGEKVQRLEKRLLFVSKV